MWPWTRTDTKDSDVSEEDDDMEDVALEPAKSRTVRFVTGINSNGDVVLILETPEGRTLEKLLMNADTAKFLIQGLEGAVASLEGHSKEAVDIDELGVQRKED